MRHEYRAGCVNTSSILGSGYKFGLPWAVLARLRAVTECVGPGRGSAGSCVDDR